MSDIDAGKFDREVHAAWAAFRNRIADAVADMTDDQLLVVESRFDDTNETGIPPCVQFLGWGGGWIRCEVSSNPFLGHARQLRASDIERLHELGFGEPVSGPDGSPAYFLDAEPAQADRIAAIAVAALREVWHFAHPSFLRVIVDAEDRSREFGVACTVSELPPLHILSANIAENREHMRNLIDRSFALMGHYPFKDEDGDVVVPAGRVVMFIEADARLPEIQLWSPLVCNVADRTRAAEHLADISRSWRHIRFVLTGGRIQAVVDVPAYPFVPQHFLELVEHFRDFLLGFDDAFAARLGGTIDSGEKETIESFDDDDDLPPALTAIIDVDPDGRGLDPEVLLLACGRDAETIRKFIQISTSQVDQWRAAALDARTRSDYFDAQRIDDEADAWSNTAQSLTAALRLLTAPASRERIERIRKPRQLELFPDPAEHTLFTDTALSDDEHC
ncbi:hypothetical protein [Antrihabitans sp. YC2-6]|uniref:T3SS (YopN, CesT) and YbjN peptide-binding chaperone 1 n=1 Tax=Antrihabitans sp. YC2-6 TaxID=2799498 RepID=UPI0018F647E3|nr:hypothetical protein [Antrihabitans sp. YC2-6]MBJ8348058.1 hypothetical protein [Antrihabitans sp. YC2-6]